MRYKSLALRVAWDAAIVVTFSYLVYHIGGADAALPFAIFSSLSIWAIETKPLMLIPLALIGINFLLLLGGEKTYGAAFCLGPFLVIGGTFLGIAIFFGKHAGAVFSPKRIDLSDRPTEENSQKDVESE